ncbi:MAG TPA: hypothetical protein VLA75_14005 [Thermoanaerobaculia bacterium]|nr:hypothetical protein [Thermoanaerobaculia bacterium]
MRRTAWIVVCLLLLAVPGAIRAQEHYTEGPVWEVWCARTAQGHAGDYLKYLRANYLPIMQEQVAQGLIVGVKFFLHTPGSPAEPDICIATQHASFGAALDYSAEFDSKMKAIAAKHYKTEDEKKQEETIAPRFEMRKDLGTTYYREIQLKPMP